MYCDLCQTRKLRREFPSDAITEKCEHAPLHCLRVSAISYSLEMICIVFIQEKLMKKAYVIPVSGHTLLSGRGQF